MEEQTENLKAYFENVSCLVFEIKALETEIENLKCWKVQRFAIPLLEECKKRIEELNTQRLEAVKLIENLKNAEYRKLLTLKYLENMKDDEIAEVMYFSRTTLYTYLGGALDELASAECVN